MARQEHCAYCFDSLIAHFEKKKNPPPLFENDKMPLFVTWHKHNTHSGDLSLRGCIGTFGAKELHSGLAEYALTSAFKDRRFSPIVYHEVPSLSCGVSLLHRFEQGQDAWDWEIGTHGIIIDFTDPKGINRNATYLPEVAKEQEWDQEETLTSLIKKAGYDGRVTEPILQSLKLTRYQSSKYELHYNEYMKLR